MIRRVFKNLLKKLTTENKKFNEFLEKYNLPKAYFAVNRKAITKGILVGLFWAFIPMPMQMAGVMATTPFIKFNVPIALATVWLSNPITYPFMFYIEYKVGNFLLGKEEIKNIELTTQWFSQHWSDIALSMYVGAAFFSTIVAYLIYLLINRLWVHSVRKEKREKRDKKAKKSQPSL